MGMNWVLKEFILIAGARLIKACKHSLQPRISLKRDVMGMSWVLKGVREIDKSLQAFDPATNQF